MVKCDARAIVGQSLDHGGRGFVLVADFHLRANGRSGLLNRNPIYRFHFERSRAQSIVLADYDAILFGVNRPTVDGLAAGEPESLALADGVIVHASVSADDGSVLRDNVAFLIVHGLAAFPRIGMNELDVIAVGHKTQFHALGLFGYGQIHLARECADFFLRQFAKREFAAGKLLLRKSPKEIRLIFALVARAQELIAAGLLIPADAGIVAPGPGLRSDLAGHAQQRLELHVGIAVGARNGSAAGQILLDEGPHHALLELFLEID